MKSKRNCAHHPHRQFASIVPAVHGDRSKGEILWVACNDCGRVLERAIPARKGKRGEP